jgi:hypothetical protein
VIVLNLFTALILEVGEANFTPVAPTIQVNDTLNNLYNSMNIIGVPYRKSEARFLNDIKTAV